MRWTDVTPKDALSLLKNDPTLAVLDVRTPPEYESHHIDGANLIPVQVLDQHFDKLDKKVRYLVVCEHGRRSEAACEFLSQQGFEGLWNITGGMAQWVGEGLPIGRGLPASMQPQQGDCGNHCGCASAEPATERLERTQKPTRKGLWGGIRAMFGG